MTGKLAAFLATLAYIATGVSGIFIVAQPSSLGVSGSTLQIIGGWLALGGSIFGVVVIAIRRNLIPGVTTGVGNEPPNAVTSTITERTTIEKP